MNGHVTMLRYVCFILGSIAQLAVAEERPTPHVTESRYREHVEFLAGDELEGRKVDSPGLARASDYILEHWKKLGIEPPHESGYVQGFAWTGKWGDIGGAAPRSDPNSNREKNRVTVRNLIGVFPGQGDLKNEAVIVSAHHDHMGRISGDAIQAGDDICNGADDNASGVAVMLMLATQLVAHRDELPESFRTVLFAAFDAEERGLVGSRYYVENPVWPLEKTAIVLNYDMVGRPVGRNLLCMDAESCPDFAPIFSYLARDYGFIAETRLGGSGRSDNAPFLGKQIPAIHFNTGIHPDYHQVTDESDRLNYADATRLARASYHVLRAALERQEPFEYRQPNPLFDIPALVRVATKLGIVPNQNAQNGKYPQILFVVPGSPAAKAGIKAGDQLLAINGAEIRRIQDAVALFTQLNLRVDLRLTMLRMREKVVIDLPASIFAEILGPVPERLPDGEYRVVFRFVGNHDTQSVHLAGSFNDWDTSSLRMDGPNDKSAFEKELVLDEGVYEYKFVINTNQWTSDPNNAHRVGQYQNSVLWVGNQ